MSTFIIEKVLVSVNLHKTFKKKMCMLSIIMFSIQRLVIEFIILTQIWFGECGKGIFNL